MSLELAGLLAAVGVPLIGALIGVGKLIQMIRDHEKRLTRLEADDDAEDAAALRRRYEQARNK